MAEKRIEPGWRYSLAQTLLWALFGRRWHFISPWANAGVGVGVVITNPQGTKVLLQQRAGAVENAGKWGVFGGFLNIEHAEDFPHGAAREIEEESGLRVDPHGFGAVEDTVIIHHKPMHAVWRYSWVATWYYRSAPEDLIERVQNSDEVSAYRWVDEATLLTMWRKGEIAGSADNTYAAVQRAFARAKLAPLPPLLVLA